MLACKFHESLFHVESEEVVKLFDGQFNGQVTSWNIVDCRYPYEFNGGHICNAINLFTFQQVKEHFFSISNEYNKNNRNIIIFHCEFSSERAPRMAMKFRSFDRTKNFNFYPQLDYPEIYLINGGYKAFFEYCLRNSRLDLIVRMTNDTFGYTPMSDRKFRFDKLKIQHQIRNEKLAEQLDVKLQYDGNKTPTSPGITIEKSIKMKEDLL